MDTPNTYTDINETGCCAVPNTKQWDETDITLNGALFVRMHTRNFLHIPLNMAKVMSALQQTAINANAQVPNNQAMTLTRDISPWKAEQLYRVSKPIDGADMVTLSGTYASRVFEGPFKNASLWYSSMHGLLASRNLTPKNIYMFYTTCPKCAKHYGKNYVYCLAEQ